MGMPRSLRVPLRVPRARPWNEASFTAEGRGGVGLRWLGGLIARFGWS